MKNKIIVLSSFLLLSCLSYSQNNCSDISINYDSLKLKELYEFYNHDTLSASIKFDSTKHENLFLRVYQAVGRRPIYSFKLKISKPQDIKIPIRFHSSELESQYLIVVLTASEEEHKKKIRESNKCVYDTIFVNKSRIEKDYFWKHGVNIKTSISINEENLSHDNIALIESNGIETSPLNYTYDASSNFKITYSLNFNEKKLYMPFYGKLRSNNDNIKFDIFLNAHTLLQKQLGIKHLDELTNIDDKAKKKLLKKNPELEFLFYDNIKYSYNFKKNLTNIILTTVTDEKGNKYYEASEWITKYLK